MSALCSRSISDLVCVCALDAHGSLAGLMINPNQQCNLVCLPALPEGVVIERGCLIIKMMCGSFFKVLSKGRDKNFACSTK